VDVSWQPPAGGPTPTGYVLRTDTGVTQYLAADARNFQLTGLPDGASVTVTITASNAGGEGPGSSATAQLPGAPTVEVVGTGASETSVSVDFATDDHGSPITECAIATSGKSATGDCSSLTIGGLKADTSYTVTLTVTNDIGTASKNVTVHTTKPAPPANPTIWGTVQCNSTSYCPNGPSRYKCPDQQSCAWVGYSPDGSRWKATCREKDLDGKTINAAQYNGGKESVWWVKLAGGDGYIPYAWYNLDSGNKLEDLPVC
jgi:hypothetical protein